MTNISSWRADPSPALQPILLNHGLFLRRLHHFLDLYEDGADSAGVDCQNVYDSVIGAAVLKKQTTNINLLEECSQPDKVEAKFADAVPLHLKGDNVKTERISATNAEVLPLKDNADGGVNNNVSIELSEIERIQAEVRGHKSQEEKGAVEMDHQLNVAFSGWRKKIKGIEHEVTNSGGYDKEENPVDDNSLPEFKGLRESVNAAEFLIICQFLVDFELERLEDDNLLACWHSKDVALSSSALDQQFAMICESGKEYECNMSFFSKQRCSSIKGAVDDVSYSRLQQKLPYLLEFRGKLQEEKWSAGVDIGLIITYFKVLLEFLVSQFVVSNKYLADMKDQLKSNQDELRVSKTSLLASRSEVDSVRAENAVLSTFVDQLTEEIESCQSEIQNCRDALKDASLRSAQSRTECHELHERTEVLRREVEGRLEKEVAEVRRLAEELELVRWEHAAESSVYFEVVDDTFARWSESNTDLRTKHINLEVELEERLKNAVAEVGVVAQHVEDLRWERKMEQSILMEIFDDMGYTYSQRSMHLGAELNKESELNERLNKEVRKLSKMVRELEDTTWEQTGESSIYTAMLHDIANNSSQKIRHLRVDFKNELEKKDAEGKRLLEDVKTTLIGQDAESSMSLEIVDTISQQWALEVDKMNLEFSTKEGDLNGVLQQKNLEINKLTEELELTLWEHEAESSIYLEVVGERACEWRQLIEDLAIDFNRKQIVRRKELQASCSFSGRTQKENLAYEDSLPLVQGDIEGLKNSLKRPSPLKGLSTYSDQSVSSPGKSIDPIYVVVRRNTQAAVEGFMVDIGESPSKKSNKEAVSFLKLEVLDLRREKEQLVEQHKDDLNRLEFELRKEIERLKGELEDRFQKEIAKLHEKVESEPRKETEPIKGELEQKFELRVANFEVADLQEKLKLERRKSDRIRVELEQKHQNEIEELQWKLESEHRMEAERIRVELARKYETEIADLQQKREVEAAKKSEWTQTAVEQRLEHEITVLKDKLMFVKQKAEQDLQDNRSQQFIHEETGDVLLEDSKLGNLTGTSDAHSELKANVNETLLTQFEVEVETLVAERIELCEKVTNLELEICELQEKVTKLEGERSWLEERVPGLEKKLATEQSRLEDTVAGHAFERDQLKQIVSSHKNEQARLENELSDKKAERNFLATAIAMLGLACRNLKVSNQNERERWRSAYVMALKDMERALSRTQKQVKEERAQKGSAESDAQRMKVEIYTMQQESKDVWRQLERNIAEQINRAVGTSQQVEYAVCRKINQQSLRFEALQQQVDSLLYVFRQSQMSEMDYLHTVENFRRAEEEVDVLGDEVDSLVALLEKVHVLLDQYAPVLLHYPGVTEVAKVIENELSQRTMVPNFPS